MAVWFLKALVLGTMAAAGLNATGEAIKASVNTDTEQVQTVTE